MDASKSILIVAGEASADLHGAEVMLALHERAADVQVFGVGGAAMRSAGLQTLVPAEDISVAGLTEVLFALPRMVSYMRTLVQAAKERQPQVAILIDLPDFNLRLAKRLKRLGIPVVYYISPQLWAWRQGRVKQIRAWVDRMLVILPFEQDFYQKHGVSARFVGHPLVEELAHSPSQEDARHTLGLHQADSPVVALLPGSRKKEIARNLPTMLEGVRLLKTMHPNLQAVLPVASTIPRLSIEAAVQHAGLEVLVLNGDSTTALCAADVAFVCSGTATLQTALLARPMVIVYRVSWLTYQILKRLVRVAHIGLVNLIAGKALVPELIQGAFTPVNLAQEAAALLADKARQSSLAKEFSRLKAVLGNRRAAGEVAAVLMGYLPPASKVVSSENNLLTGTESNPKKAGA